uniref:Uncharacterized protein n=1 Tax=Trichogramma kaykai TaxID=54128 RepID=A0ABD2WK02_9HYME
MQKRWRRSNKNELTASQKKMDEKIFIDFECKNVKPELKSLKQIICKIEYKTCAPLVKVESPVQIRYSEEKSPIILIKKNFNYHNDCHFEGISVKLY